MQRPFYLKVSQYVHMLVLYLQTLITETDDEGKTVKGKQPEIKEDIPDINLLLVCIKLSFLCLKTYNPNNLICN